MDKYNPVSAKVCSPKDNVMNTRETNIKEATDKELTCIKTTEELMTKVPINTFLRTKNGIVMENSLLFNTGPVGDLVAEYHSVFPEPNCQAIVTNICTVMLSGLSLKEESMLDEGN